MLDRLQETELHRDFLIEKHQPCPSGVWFLGKIMKSVSIPSTAWNIAFTMFHFQYTLKTFKHFPLLFAWKYTEQRVAKLVSEKPGPEHQRDGLYVNAGA